MRVVQLAASAVFGILIARELGAETFGAYNLARAIAQLLFLVAAFGLDKVLVRELAREPEAASATLGAATLIRLTIAVALVPIALLSAKGLSAGTDSLVALTLVFSLSSAIRAADIYTAWNESQLYQRDTAISLIGSTLAAGALRAACLLLDTDAIWFAGCVAAESLFVFFSLRWFYQQRDPAPLAVRPSPRTAAVAKGLAHEAWPLVINALLVYVYLRSDAVMLGLLKGNESVGIYSAALQISETFSLIPVAIVSLLAPSLHQLCQSSRPEFSRRLRMLLELTNLGCVSAAVIIGLLSEWAVEFLFGAEYSESSDILVIHVWSSLFATHGGLRSVWLLAQGRQKYGLYTVAAGALLNVGLNLLWIPEYGGVGAAYATVIANLVAALAGNVVSAHLRGFLRLQIASILPVVLCGLLWRSVRQR